MPNDPSKTILAEQYTTHLQLHPVRHSLPLLKRQITHETQQGSRRYYPIIDDTLTADVQTVIAVEEHKAKATILNAICDSNEIPITTFAIAEMTIYDISTIRHHINRLEADSLIERARQGEKTTISLSDDYADIINRLMVN